MSLRDPADRVVTRRRAPASEIQTGALAAEPVSCQAFSAKRLALIENKPLDEATSNLIRRGWKPLRGLEPRKLVLFEGPGEEWSKISA